MDGRRKAMDSRELAAGAPFLTRRSLLVITAAGAGLAIQGCRIPPSTRSPSPGRLQDPLPEEMLKPEETGTLKAAETETMWRLFADIGRRWKNGQLCLLTREGFADILDLKTQLVPSYLEEYRLTTRVLADLERESGPASAMDMLFAIPANAPATTIAGHIRRYTISELLRVQVSHGAFRSFGYVNYPGFAGGGYADPDHLPYRKASP